MYKPRYWGKYAKSLSAGLRFGARYAPVARMFAQRYAGAPVSKYVQKSRKKAPVRRPYRKRVYRKRPYVNKVKKDVARLKQQVDSNTSTYIKKARAFTSLECAEASADYYSYDINTVTTLQDVIDSVKYFNPSSPGTLISVNLSTPTFQNQVRFVSTYAKAIARNNYGVPCRISFYCMRVKKDTGIQVETSMNNSLTDMSNATITSPLIYPSDCHDFRDLWTIDKHKSMLLNPGEEVVFTHSYKSFLYDVSLSDSHTSAYQKHFYGSQIVVRIEGVLAHGSTSGETQSQCAVDLMFERHHKVTYPGGVNTIYLEISDVPDTPVGTVQISQLDHAQETYTR